MVALIWLFGAILIAHLWRHPAALIAASLAACVGGTTLPDTDFLFWLAHRSALTHSVLPILALYLWRPSQPIAAGTAVGVGFHLAADCFPNAMLGYATIKLPLAGSIGVRASYLWLAINALAALVWGAIGTGGAMAQRWRMLALGGYGVIGIAYLFVTDGGWPPLAVFGIAGWLAVRRRRAARTA